MIIFINSSGSYIFDATEEEFESNLVVKEENGKNVYIGNLSHINQNIIGWIFHSEAGYKLAQEVNASSYYLEIENDKIYKYSKRQVKRVYSLLNSVKKIKNKM